MSCGCQFATQNAGPVWRPNDGLKATPSRPDIEIYRPDILQSIEETIKDLDVELRELSLDIHGMLIIFSGLLADLHAQCCM